MIVMPQKNIIYRLGCRIAHILRMYGVRRRKYIEYLIIILRSIEKYKGKHIMVLDLGCGSGSFLYLLIRKAGKKVIGIGVDILQYDEWFKYSIKERNITFLLSDARLLPFRTNSIDIIVAFSLLEHVDGWEKIVGEVHKVLRVGGVFIIQLPNLEYLIEPHTKFPLLKVLPKRLKSIISFTAEYPELQFNCTLVNVLKRLKRCEFKVIGVYYHYHSEVQRLFIVPPSYIIIAMKSI